MRSANQTITINIYNDYEKISTRHYKRCVEIGDLDHGTVHVDGWIIPVYRDSAEGQLWTADLTVFRTPINLDYQALAMEWLDFCALDSAKEDLYEKIEVLCEKIGDRFGNKQRAAIIGAHELILRIAQLLRERGLDDPAIDAEDLEGFRVEIGEIVLRLFSDWKAGRRETLKSVVKDIDAYFSALEEQCEQYEQQALTARIARSSSIDDEDITTEDVNVFRGISRESCFIDRLAVDIQLLLPRVGLGYAWKRASMSLAHFCEDLHFCGYTLQKLYDQHEGLQVLRVPELSTAIDSEMDCFVQQLLHEAILGTFLDFMLVRQGKAYYKYNDVKISNYDGQETTVWAPDISEAHYI